jgi:hypothetical protein
MKSTGSATIEWMSQRTEVVLFGGALLLLCLYWIYGYLRRRSRKRY